MIYLDTGCLVKLYYPEPESSAVIRRVAGRPIFFTPLHELEATNALALKVFQGQATGAQVAASLTLFQADLASGALVAPTSLWQVHIQSAIQLALLHTPVIGCRSIDILHCATAAGLHAAEFISTDVRQSKLASSMGLNWTPI